MSPKVKMRLAALKDIQAHEIGLRFVFGGACSLSAALIARHWGPGIGGLFLAFPAIFPAGVSLVEKHHRKNVAAEGGDGETQGRLAASVDAAGAALGCLGLVAFALVVGHELPLRHAAVVLMDSMLAWLIVVAICWKTFGGRIESVMEPD
jgi:hypothetical protein